MVIMACIKVFVVPSMFPQGNINDLSTKQQWNIKVSEIRSIKPLKIINVCIEITKSYQNFFIGSSTVNQSSSEGTSTFWRLWHQKLQWYLAFASNSSQCHQCFFEESSTKHQWRSNETSMIQRSTQQNNRDQKFFHRTYQCLNYVSTKYHQRSWTKQQGNNNVSQIRSIKPLKINKACIEIFTVTSMFLQRIINESSMNQQWNITDSEFNTTQTIKIKKSSHRIYQDFNNVCPMYPQRSSTKQQWNINVSEIKSK